MSEGSRVAGTHRPLRDTSFITSVAARARPNAVWSEVTSAWHRSCVLCIVIPPVWRSRTRYTTPNVPLPICRSLVYCWRFRSDVGVGSKGAMVCLGGPSARVAELKVMEVTQQATGRAAVRPCQSVSSGESTSHTVTRVASNHDCVMFRWLFKKKEAHALFRCNDSAQTTSTRSYPVSSAFRSSSSTSSNSSALGVRAQCTRFAESLLTPEDNLVDARHALTSRTLRVSCPLNSRRRR